MGMCLAEKNLNNMNNEKRIYDKKIAAVNMMADVRYEPLVEAHSVSKESGVQGLIKEYL